MIRFKFASLDDRFHETSSVGTGDSVVDSCLYLIERGVPAWQTGGRQSNWRCLAKRLRTWQLLPAREAKRRGEWSGRRYCLRTVRSPRSSLSGKDWVCIIRRFNAAWSGRWPMAHWWRLMIGLARARSRRLHPRRKRGWYLWLATRPRITGIRTSCGRRGSWHGMHASTRRRRGPNVLPSWRSAPAAGHKCFAKLAQGPVCKIVGHEEVKPHKVRSYLERLDAQLEQNMAEV